MDTVACSLENRFFLEAPIRSWLGVVTLRYRQLDTGQLFRGYTYLHEFARHDGAVVTSDGRRTPGDWRGDDAKMLRP